VTAPGTAPTRPVDQLTEAFARADAEQRALLVGYLPAGFPTVAGGQAMIAAMVEGGVDVVEVGLPYSDPVMDGPTIQAAAQTALDRGTRIFDVLSTVEATARLGVPTLVMTYWNPVERYGVGTFGSDLAAAGGAGLITPDLLPEEAGPWFGVSDDLHLARIFLVAPSSTERRIAAAAAACRGFVYATSVMGVTGARVATSTAAPTLVGRVRAVSGTPVGVGLGVSDGAQAAEVAGYADAVIVGSAFVRQILDAADESAAATAVRELAADLAAGVRNPVRDRSAVPGTSAATPAVSPS
jgi:tryptophan synthase alpha chain